MSAIANMLSKGGSRPVNGARLALEELEGAELDLLKAALADPMFSGVDIARALTEDGYRCTSNAVNAVRREMGLGVKS